MLNYGNYHGKYMIINTNSARSHRQLYDYDVFSRPPKYMYLCLVTLGGGWDWRFPGCMCEGMLGGMCAGVCARTYCVVQ